MERDLVVIKLSISSWSSRLRIPCRRRATGPATRTVGRARGPTTGRAVGRPGTARPLPSSFSATRPAITATARNCSVTAGPGRHVAPNFLEHLAHLLHGLFKVFQPLFEVLGSAAHAAHAAKARHARHSGHAHSASGRRHTGHTLTGSGR